MLSFHMLSSLSLSALPLSCNGLQHRKIASDKISCNFFRRNTSASVDSTPLPLLQNECLHKTLGGRGLMVNQKSDRDFCPEEHRDDRPLFPTKDFCPERPSEASDLSR